MSPDQVAAVVRAILVMAAPLLVLVAGRARVRAPSPARIAAVVRRS
jgi:hypothetical protein